MVLGNGENKVGYRALIDSGADYNIFPGALANTIDLTFDEKYVREFSGLGGAKIKAYGTDVDLEIGGVRFKTKVYFSPDLPKSGRAVLGQIGFFDHFRVKFEYDIKNIELTPVRRR